MANPKTVVEIDYTNWRGERRLRRILPLNVWFENNEWHPDTQWLLEAVDCEDRKTKSFAMSSIHSWKAAPGHQQSEEKHGP